MDVVVFAGPSTAGIDPAKRRGAEWRGPARRGDVTALGRRPAVIGLIDGMFETCPSVLHKELLDALAEGVIVAGAASMGALRAVELAPFGMIGIGQIVQDYQSGMLEDDAEVAVLHAPAELGYRPLTEALVNVRATLRAAVAGGVIDDAAHDAYLELARALFYKDRTYRSLFGAARARGRADAEVEALARWCSGHAVDQKRVDAEALVDALPALAARAAPPPSARPRLSRTRYWVEHERQFAAVSADALDLDGHVRQRAQ